MATQGMAYDDAVYRARILPSAANAAGASAVYGRFAVFTGMLAKSMFVSVTTAGTGTGNATVTLIRIASGGTALTTLASTTMGTSSAGVSTNIAVAAASQVLTAGDLLYIQNGADATGVWTVALELVLQPGATVTV